MDVVSSPRNQEGDKYPYHSSKISKWYKDFTHDIDVNTLNTKIGGMHTNPHEHMDSIVKAANSIRGKKPSFIGTFKTSDGKHKEFSTHLDPVEASKRYEEHMRKGSNTDFVRHSDTHFEYKQGTSTVHNINSVPGRIIHVSHDTQDYYKQKNTEIFEQTLINKAIEHLSINN